MPRFFVRIELPEPPKADYEELHAKMEAARYYRTVETTNGLRQLPHATYTSLGRRIKFLTKHSK
jgi:hypothetical protein